MTCCNSNHQTHNHKRLPSKSRQFRDHQYHFSSWIFPPGKLFQWHVLGGPVYRQRASAVHKSPLQHIVANFHRLQSVCVSVWFNFSSISTSNTGNTGPFPTKFPKNEWKWSSDDGCENMISTSGDMATHTHRHTKHGVPIFGNRPTSTEIKTSIRGLA